jgi:hypothetical protein
MSDIDEMVLEDLDVEAEDDEDDEAEDEPSEFNPFDPVGLFGGGPFGLLKNGGRRRAPATAASRPYYTPQFQPYVTQPQFSTALNKIRADVTKNTAAIKTVDTRVAAQEAVNRAQSQALTKQSKINRKQSVQIAGVKRDLQQSQQNSLLLMLLTRPKATTAAVTGTDFSANGAVVPQGNKILIQPEKDNSMLLAIALMGGMGGGSDSGGQMMFLALALSGGL